MEQVGSAWQPWQEGRPPGPIRGPGADRRAQLSASSSQPAIRGTINCCHLRVACGEKEGGCGEGKEKEGGGRGGGCREEGKWEEGGGRTACPGLSILSWKEREPPIRYPPPPNEGPSVPPTRGRARRPTAQVGQTERCDSAHPSPVNVPRCPQGIQKARPPPSHPPSASTHPQPLPTPLFATRHHAGRGSRLGQTPLSHGAPHSHSQDTQDTQRSPPPPLPPQGQSLHATSSQDRHPHKRFWSWAPSATCTQGTSHHLPVPPFPHL